MLPSLRRAAAHTGVAYTGSVGARLAGLWTLLRRVKGQLVCQAMDRAEHYSARECGGAALKALPPGLLKLLMSSSRQWATFGLAKHPMSSSLLSAALA